MAIVDNINTLVQAYSDLITTREAVRNVQDLINITLTDLASDMEDANNNGVAGINGGAPGFLLDGTHIYSRNNKKLQVHYELANNRVVSVALVKEGADISVVTL